MSENYVTVVGTLGRDPELRFTQTGRGVSSFGMAVNERWKDRNDEWQEKTSWFDVTAWGPLGENVANSLSKGDRVIVAGKLEQQTWDDRETGAKRSKVQIVADEIGAALRFANVTIDKIEREKPTARQDTGDVTGQADMQPEDPW